MSLRHDKKENTIINTPSLITFQLSGRNADLFTRTQLLGIVATPPAALVMVVPSAFLLKYCFFSPFPSPIERLWISCRILDSDGLLLPKRFTSPSNHFNDMATPLWRWSPLDFILNITAGFTQVSICHKNRKWKKAWQYKGTLFCFILCWTKLQMHSTNSYIGDIRLSVFMQIKHGFRDITIMPRNIISILKWFKRLSVLYPWSS